MFKIGLAKAESKRTTHVAVSLLGAYVFMRSVSFIGVWGMNERNRH